MAPKVIEDEPNATMPRKTDESLITYKDMTLPMLVAANSFKYANVPQQQMFYQDQASDGYSYHYSDESKQSLSFSGSIKSKDKRRQQFEVRSVQHSNKFNSTLMQLQQDRRQTNDMDKPKPKPSVKDADDSPVLDFEMDDYEI
jgi:hypothetical protein